MSLGFVNSSDLFFLFWDVDYLCSTASYDGRISAAIHIMYPNLSNILVIQANMNCLLSNETQEKVNASNCIRTNKDDLINYCT